MAQIILIRPTRALAAGALTAVAAACASDAPSGPTPSATPDALLAAAEARAGGTTRGPDLAGCEQLRAPAGSKLVARLYATGVQVYRWTGTAWQFEGPSAALYARPAGRQIGTHYAGPTWEARDGSTVRGSAPVPCVKNPSAIPWLRLTGTPGDRRGLLHRATVIQRVNTVGGLTPAAPGAAAGEERRVPYTAEYYFYRTR